MGAWIAIDTVLGKKSNHSEHVSDKTTTTTVQNVILEETTEYSNQSLIQTIQESTGALTDDLTITETLSATIQFDSGVIYRGIVVCLFCSLIFFCSCCIKRRCRKKQLRRYDLLESQNGLIMDGDSDSDEIDIFDKANAKE